MNIIRIVGALIFIFSITLAVIFNYTNKTNTKYNNLINTINEQKHFTQEISKNIFYIYKNKNTSTVTLNYSIKYHLKYMRNKTNTLTKTKKLIHLWNRFYLEVQKFRDTIKIKSPYSSIILEKNVNNIYKTNLKLIIEFDKLLKEQESYFNKQQNIFKYIQYSLFFILFLLLIYLFTQLKTLLSFIQKFLFTSKSIISDSSIKSLEPIDISKNAGYISQANDNFNILVDKINTSIDNSTNSIKHSCKSLEITEQHIEKLIDFIYTMDDNSRDKELRQKEDAIIQSLEELSKSSQKLKNLKNDLDKLTSHYK